MDDFTLGSSTARASAQGFAGDGWEEQYAHSLGMQAYSKQGEFQFEVQHPVD